MYKINILLICGNLSYAGSQRQLVELAKHMDRKKFKIMVCSISGDVQLKPELEKAGIRVIVLDKRFRQFISIIYDIRKLLIGHKIHIIYPFLFEANIVARIAGKLAKTPVVISSERSSFYKSSFHELLVERLTAKFYDLVIANSYAGKSFLMKTQDITDEKIKVIWNGFDFKRFDTGSSNSNNNLKKEFGIPDDAIIVGIIARFKPDKNYEMFFKVVKKVIEKYPDVYFLSIGDVSYGQDDYYKELMVFLKNMKIKERLFFAGKRLDITETLKVLAISVLTSWREGFPNAVIESMAAGVPVIVTDAGDNSLIVENGVNGFIVPVNDANAMVNKIGILIKDINLRREMGRRNKGKTVDLFAVEKMVKNTEFVLLELYKKKSKSL